MAFAKLGVFSGHGDADVLQTVLGGNWDAANGILPDCAVVRSNDGRKGSERESHGPEVLIEIASFVDFDYDTRGVDIKGSKACDNLRMVAVAFHDKSIEGNVRHFEIANVVEFVWVDSCVR